MNAQLRRLLDHQSGVVSRRQVLDAGSTDVDIRRLIRRRELVRVHPGVYVNHTGELTWLQRAWAAVLFAEPAALCHESAIRAADGPGRRRGSDGEPIHIAIERTREVARLDGVTLHLLAHLDAKTQWNLSPPRVRIEHAVVDVAAEAPSESEAISCADCAWSAPDVAVTG